MTTTTVVNIKSGVAFDVYIGRAGNGEDGYFGNPYRGQDLGGGTIGRKEAIVRFRHLFKARIQMDPKYKRRVAELKGRALGCFCSPLPCHGDVYVEYLETGKVK